MAQLQNQFSQTAEKGMLDLKTAPGSVLAARVASTEATALVPGQCVKIVDTISQVPVVTAITADADDVFGVVLYNLKNTSFSASSAMEIVFGNGSVVYMEASAAIVPYAKVTPVLSGNRVATAATGDRIIGVALDKASAAGDLIRVLVQLPGVIA